jgi:hypothetical protein
VPSADGKSNFCKKKLKNLRGVSNYECSKIYFPVAQKIKKAYWDLVMSVPSGHHSAIFSKKNFSEQKKIQNSGAAVPRCRAVENF